MSLDSSAAKSLFRTLTGWIVWPAGLKCKAQTQPQVNVAHGRQQQAELSFQTPADSAEPSSSQLQSAPSASSPVLQTGSKIAGRYEVCSFAVVPALHDRHELMVEEYPWQLRTLRQLARQQLESQEEFLCKMAAFVGSKPADLLSLV